MEANFQDLVTRLNRINLFGKAGEALPNTAGALKKAVQEGAELLPHVYGQAYVQALEASLPRLTRS